MIFYETMILILWVFTAFAFTAAQINEDIVAAANRRLEACGFRTDCPQTYTISDIITSANAWGLFDYSSFKALSQRRLAMHNACVDPDKVLDHGGWCLRKTERGKEHILANNMSYYITEFHVPPDDAVVALLVKLLTTADGKMLSLNDFGAGVGQYGRALLARNLSYLYRGYDGAGNVESFTNGFLSFADMTIPLSLPRSDWVISVEVGEHISSRYEAMFIRNLHAHNCRGIILSWAVLNQGGHSHINNHSPDYIQKIFSELGYVYDNELTDFIKNPKQDPTLGVKYVYLHRWVRRAFVLRRKVPLTGFGCS